MLTRVVHDHRVLRVTRLTRSYLDLGRMVLAREEVLEVVVLLQRLLGEQVVVLHHRHLVVGRRHRHPVHLDGVLEVALALTASPEPYVGHELARHASDLAALVARDGQHLRVAPAHHRELLALLERLRVHALQHHVGSDHDVAHAQRLVLHHQ